MPEPLTVCVEPLDVQSYVLEGPRLLRPFTGKEYDEFNAVLAQKITEAGGTEVVHWTMGEAVQKSDGYYPGKIAIICQNMTIESLRRICEEILV